MTGVQDKAEELLAKLYREGEGNVEDVTTSTEASASTHISPPSVASTTVLTLHGATPKLVLPTPNGVGQRKRVYLVQDGTGTRIASWSAATGTIMWATGVAPVLQTGAGEVNRVEFESYDGVNWYGTNVGVEELAAGEFTALTTTGNADVGGTLGIDGVVTADTHVNVGGNLEVTGTSALDGDVTTEGAVNVGTNLDVSGTSALDGTVTTLADVKVGTDITVGTTLSVTGSSTLSGGAKVPTGQAVAIEGNSTLTTGTGDVKLGGVLSVTGHVGFNGQAAVGKSGAYTLTYSTEARTVPAATAAGVATTEPKLAEYGFSKANAEALIAAVNAGQADLLALKKVVVALVKDLQAVGIAA